MSDSNIAYNFDLNKLIEAHVATGADVTVMYEKRRSLPASRTTTTPCASRTAG